MVKSLTKKLFAFAACWKRENHLFPMEWYWLYQTHPRTGFIIRYYWSIQNRLWGWVYILLFWFCVLLLFCLCAWEGKNMLGFRPGTNDWSTHLSKWAYLPGFPCIPQSLPFTGSPWLAYLTPDPEVGQVCWASCFYMIQPFWLPLILVPLVLLAAILGSPLSPLSLPSSTPCPHMAEFSLLWTFPDVASSSYSLPHISRINFIPSTPRSNCILLFFLHSSFLSMVSVFPEILSISS